MYEYNIGMESVGQIKIEEGFPETPEAAFAADDGEVYIFGVKLFKYIV